MESKQSLGLCKLSFPPDQRRRVNRQVRVVECLQGWKHPTSRGICVPGRRGDGSDKAIAFGRYRLDVSRLRRIVSQGVAQLTDGGVQRVIDVQLEIASPYAFDNLLPEDELPLPLDEQEEQLHRDSFETERPFAPPELEVGGIELESAKSQETRVRHIPSPCVNPSRS
jgi:hypothetical protein